MLRAPIPVSRHCCATTFGPRRWGTNIHDRFYVSASDYFAKVWSSLRWIIDFFLDLLLVIWLVERINRGRWEDTKIVNAIKLLKVYMCILLIGEKMKPLSFSTSRYLGRMKSAFLTDSRVSQYTKQLGNTKDYTHRRRWYFSNKTHSLNEKIGSSIRTRVKTWPSCFLVFQMMFELRFPVTCTRHVSPDTCDIVASPSFSIIPFFQTTLISVLTDAERFDRVSTEYSTLPWNKIAHLRFRTKKNPTRWIFPFKLLVQRVRRFDDY